MACLPFTRNTLILTTRTLPQNPLVASGLSTDKCSTEEKRKKKKEELCPPRAFNANRQAQMADEATVTP